MKIYQKEFSYDYSFPTVTLAWFLRYPNPYSKHVMSTDVIDRYLDPTTQRLHTLRLHLKRSKVPAAVLKFLPGAMIGQGGASQTYILEKSTVDVKEGWMETESRNMEWTGVLSVIEKQTYKDQSLNQIPSSSGKKDRTTCLTTVTFVSKLGQGVFSRKKKLGSDTTDDEEHAPKQGFFASWSTAGIQRTIELVGVTRTKTALVNSKEGMTLVLERLRNGGIVGVLEGMRRDRMEMMGINDAPVEAPSWRKVWAKGQKKARHEDEDD